MELLKSNKYKSIVEKFNKIDDKPVCLFVYSNFETLPPHERCKIYSMDKGIELESEEKGFILLLKLNKESRVEQINYCDACECYPCDCNWGN